MIARLFFVFLLIPSTFGQKQGRKPAQPWLTLNGQSPSVIARGGFSGLFPESSEVAYTYGMSASLPNTILYCSLQLSKDGEGFCLSSLNLDNATFIEEIFPNEEKSYNVNGQQMQGYFALDYTADQLSNVSLMQNIFTRTNVFDGVQFMFPIGAATEIQPPPRLWLNVQYSNFYAEHKLNPALYIPRILRTVGISYISSPEIGFLKNINGKVNKVETQLIFVFLEADAVEPTTNQTYSSLLKDLSSIKLFASGILVPKEYIWPVNAQMYLEAPTTLVTDAHKRGLEVYAYDFANDNVASYNYSYDPTAEYLQFIDNSQFSVDGFLTDFPPSASEAIACLAHNKNASRPLKGKPLVITYNGAGGVYPGSTDLAYQQAVNDGADIIDCSVQMSKDGIAFCLNTTDLATATTAKEIFLSRSAIIPEIQSKYGIFSFDLTWSEIQTLQPLMASPYAIYGMERNPENDRKGKLITLAEFLEFSKKKKVPGILINIKNAPYLASKKGLSITNAVATALSNATFDKQSTQQVLIQSDDSAVLSEFSNVSTYEKVLLIEDDVSDAPKPTVDEIKKFASAINLRKFSIIPKPIDFTSAATAIVEEMHNANISVYASVFRNEYVALAMDFFTDPIVELAAFILPPIKVDGVITEYPATATAYLRSPCSNPDAKLDYSILPCKPGLFLHDLPEIFGIAPAAAPSAALRVSDIVDPPLPPVSKVSEANGSASAASALPPGKSSQTANVANLGLSPIAIMALSLLSIWPI